MPTRRPYSTDLSDEEWEILRPLVPEAKPGGRPRAHRTREILNASQPNTTPPCGDRSSGPSADP
jgi:hypothetical protein